MKTITVKYHGPTDSKGARLKASDESGNNITIPFPYELNRDAAHAKAARALCEKIGYTGKLCRGWTTAGTVFVSDRDFITV